MCAVAKTWLENVSLCLGETQLDDLSKEAWRNSRFAPVFLYGLRVSSVSNGRALCSFTVPPHLTDEEENWQPGSIATLIDMVAAAVIISSEGTIKVSVDFDISFFSPAKLNDEVEIKAHTTKNKGKLTAVVVEIRKKENGRLVAVGREWMTSSSARPFESKL